MWQTLHLPNIIFPISLHTFCIPQTDLTVSGNLNFALHNENQPSNYDHSVLEIFKDSSPPTHPQPHKHTHYLWYYLNGTASSSSPWFSLIKCKEKEVSGVEERLITDWDSQNKQQDLNIFFQLCIKNHTDSFGNVSLPVWYWIQHQMRNNLIYKGPRTW